MGFFTAAAAIAASAYGTYSSSKAKHDAEKGQARINDYNARVAEQDARATEQMTKFEQLQQLRRGQRIMGSLKARLGASGALVSEGAPLALLADQAFELELENALIGAQGRTQASRYQSEAQGYRLGAGTARQRASAATTAGYLNVGSTILGGFSSMYGQGMFGGGSSKGYYSGTAPGD